MSTLVFHAAQRLIKGGNEELMGIRGVEENGCRSEVLIIDY